MLDHLGWEIETIMWLFAKIHHDENQNQGEVDDKKGKKNGEEG